MLSTRLALPVLLLVAPVSTAQVGRPDAETLVTQAWQFLPAYDGDHRSFLSEELRRDVVVGAHLVGAAVELDPGHLRGLWSSGHAHILLGEDRRNRGLREEAREHYKAAVSALSRAIEIQPSDPWACYARGAAHTAFGEHEAALADLTRAVENADVRIERGDDSVSWLRFKAREWQTEVRMRMGDHEAAREDLRAFHAEFSSNEWPMLIALAESFLRERDFVGARASYDEILVKFPSDHQAYALLGYVAGLTGDRAGATARLLEAIEYELVPDMYLRLWLWILATDEARPPAEEDLRLFLENPPDSLSEWDRTLGRFTLGEGSVQEFLQTARAEETRRIDADEALDDLLCEASYYAGLRLEHDARANADEAMLRAAVDAYRAALRFDPPTWKWEWAFARAAAARLASELGLAAKPWFVVDGTHITWDGGEAELEGATWHVPGADRPVAALDRDPLPGDLLLARIRFGDGRSELKRFMVDASNR